jgi:hypothetical protein
MRDYKVRIALLFFVLTICVNPLFAQIQTKILGCRVGVSTENEVVAILQQQGYAVYNYGHRNELAQGKIIYLGVTYQIYGSILFGGVRWDVASFTFVGGKLKEVSFHCNEFNMNIHDKLLSDLKMKYSRYYKFEDESLWEQFNDGVTEIRLWNGITFCLSYSNIKLSKALNEGVYSGGASDL